MRPEERDTALAAIRRATEREGYEVLRLTISASRHVVLTLDADPGPITIDDCTTMNYKIRDALARAGLPADDYAVEVQSPGTRRALLTLRHFERFAGERARVRLKPDAPGEKPPLLIGTIELAAPARLRIVPERGDAATFAIDRVLDAHLDPEPGS